MSFNKAKEAHEKLMSERKEVPGTNKYQEALNMIKWKLKNKLFGIDVVAFDYLQELVDKETPMKNKFNSQLRYTPCGRCESYLRSCDNSRPDYCSNCGQKLDWSGEE